MSLPALDQQEIQSRPIFESGILQELRQLDPEGDGRAIREITKEFVKASQMRQERLTEAIATANFSEISAIGHTLKGSTSVFGLSRAALISRKLEIFAQAADQEAIRLLEQLLAESLAAGRAHLEADI